MNAIHDSDSSMNDLAPITNCYGLFDKEINKFLFFFFTYYVSVRGVGGFSSRLFIGD